MIVVFLNYPENADETTCDIDDSAARDAAQADLDAAKAVTDAAHQATDAAYQAVRP